MKKKPVESRYANATVKAWRIAHKAGSEEMLKACGGCKRCYGKGYGTSISFLSSVDDFEVRRAGAKPFRQQMPEIVFCKCPRAKQLYEVFVKILAKAESMSTAREVRHLLKEYLLSR